MQLRPFPESARAESSRHRDLIRLLEQPTDRETRPCPGCERLCPCPRQSTHCACGCSPRCPETARYLSSDPDRYPIEPGVLALVYALSTLRVVPPCWSCEGHLTREGQLLRLPQVWFYSLSTVYPELVSRCLDELRFRKALAHPWQVAVCPHAEGGTTIFLIGPADLDGAQVTESVLRALQRDLEMMGAALVERMRDMARRLIP